jgi:hypothetical protein
MICAFFSTILYHADMLPCIKPTPLIRAITNSAEWMLIRILIGSYAAKSAVAVFIVLTASAAFKRGPRVIRAMRFVNINPQRFLNILLQKILPLSYFIQ